MENSFDGFAKGIAGAITRRDALKMTGRAILVGLAATTGVTKVWGDVSNTLGIGNPPGGVGSSPCGGVQKAIQLAAGDFDPQKFLTLKDYLGFIKNGTGLAQKAKLITAQCGHCIYGEFADGIPVDQQSACGSIVSPSLSCADSSASEKQVEAASFLAFGAAPNAMGDEEQFELFVEVTQEILGCELGETAANNTFTNSTEGARTSDVVTQTCAAAGVDYCGKGTSTTNPGFTFETSPCLNEQCCEHDKCYGRYCVPTVCYFTSRSESTGCEAGILAACQQECYQSDSQLSRRIKSRIICSVVTCALTGPNKVCKTVAEQRLKRDPQCGQSCGSSCCDSGSICVTSADQLNSGCTSCTDGVACGNVCCAPGATCSNGSCSSGTCSPGQTSCGNGCCPAGTICSNGSCLSCGPNETPCGTVCCAPGQTCTNGSCSSSCTDPDFPQVCFGGCCRADTVCCPTANNQGACCPSGSVCECGGCIIPGTYCCGGTTVCLDSQECCVNNAGDALGCCGELPGGFTSFCCVTGLGQGAVCCATGDVCCNNFSQAWCCPNDSTCGSALECIPAS